MPAMTERTGPYIAFAKRLWSSVGATVTFLSATVTLTTGAKSLETLPLGPSTRTVSPVMVTLTLSGMGTGCLPIRLLGVAGLPNVADHFATRPLTAAVGVLHQPLRSRKDADAESVEDPGNLGVAEIEP